MERAGRARQGLAAAAVALVAGVAHADPILQTPELGRVRWEEEAVTAGFLAEMRAVGVLGATRLAGWPDRRLGVEPQRPELVAGRVGGIAELVEIPIAFVLRVDFGEFNRPELPDRAGALLGAVIDDAYAFWRPAQPLQILAGRARVPFSKERQFDEGEAALGAPPFLVDRVAPDRRWGVTVLGDLGAFAYAVGAYEDVDALEPRLRLSDPSLGGAFAAAAHLEWTPRAPMMGSNPPGRVTGARGPLPTPRADPWWDELRVSTGLGGLLRVHEDGSLRVDGSISLQLKWRWLAALAETIVSSDDPVDLGVHGTVMVMPIDLMALALRGEWDPGAPGGGQWSIAGGVSWFVTKNRRNKVGVFGWLQRDRERDTPYDGVVVFLQASL